MKKVDLGQTMNTLANVGVILGIVFLALEIRQSQVVGRAQTRNEISRAGLEMNQFSASKEIGDIVLRSDRGEELTELEEWQLDFWFSGWVNLWENLHYQYRQGLYDESEYMGNLTRMRFFLNGRVALRAYYCVRRDRGVYSPDFVSDIDALLDEPCE